MSKFVGVIVGGAEVAAGVALAIATHGAAAPLAETLIAAGAGTRIGGVGALLPQNDQIGTVPEASEETACL